MDKISGRGVEETSQLPARLILCHLQDSNEIFLATVSEPDLDPICEDWHDHRLKDSQPSEQQESTNGVPQNSKRTNCTPSTGGEGFDVEGSRQARGEKDPEVANGSGRCDVNAVPNTVP
jgi:hypothetical protein